MITHVPELSALARLAVLEDATVDFHPLYQGFRSRLDDWKDPSWRPPGGFNVLLIVKEGRLFIVDRGTSRSLDPGMAFLLRPDRLPAIYFERGIRYHETYFKINRSRHEFQCAKPLLLRHRAWTLAPIIDSLAGALRENPRGMVARHWLALVLAQFQELDDNPDRGERLLSPRQRSAAVQWARERIHQPANPEAMAQVAGLSHDYFTRLFRNTFGLAPRDWMAREKVGEACRLLEESTLRSKEIAHKLGYESASSFGRQFRQVIGLSPARYRQKNQRP